ncbi:putative nuclease HARBI1 [Cucumis melo var. makuwa]|uniref:Nuclease HARBI1 n=1 Tax=Cucumis melo var. makuwa TaxID=1194695 RepID=A0A5A7UQS6_CUCMM|nr:putative nuclease HARBI1 [Cucumis melo var. makuwa]TYK04625.1 putative nuclease HARBI1 [Cucumis melo var. makuwa]
MDQRCFTILCTMLRTRGGLEATQYVDVEETVAIFLYIVAYDVKNRVARRHFASDPFMFARAVAMVSGALDGTYIKVNVSMRDRPRWEGSASDSRVLRDAVSRPTGIKAPKGYYDLCDASYPNTEGFLALYREATFEEPHPGEGDSSEMNIENINFIETTNVLTEWRDDLANQMFEDWNNI